MLTGKTNTSGPSIRLVTGIPGPKSLELHSRRNAAVPRGIHSMLPIYVARAESVIVEDVDGNRLLDFAGGIGCVNTGHRPPEVVEAVRDQIARYLHMCFMVTPYEGYVRLAEILNEQVPGDFPKKTLLLNSGAEAVENAVKIARAYTGRPAIIVFEGGFHGRTLLTMSLTSKTHPYKAGFGPFAPEVYRLPYGYCYRCSYHLEYPQCGVECAKRLSDVFVQQVAAESVAAVLLEPILGEGGFVIPPAEWFAEISRICRQHNVLIIADEVQSGFARTGKMFACQHFGVEPDLMVTAKSLGGAFPLGAVTGRAEIMDAAGPGGLGGTFGGNPVACSAALSSWQVMRDKQLDRRAVEIGQIISTHFQRLKDRFRLVGDVRGLGAMCALELVRDRKTREPAPEETARVIAACHQRGLIILSAGKYSNVIRILVPLIITDEQLGEGLAVLESAFSEVSGIG